jgi:hypothetical protein
MNLERRVTLVISVAFIASFVAVILFYLLPGATL